jgi:hypothetical protein
MMHMFCPRFFTAEKVPQDGIPPGIWRPYFFCMCRESTHMVENRLPWPAPLPHNFAFAQCEHCLQTLSANEIAEISFAAIPRNSTRRDPLCRTSKSMPSSATSFGP